MRLNQTELVTALHRPGGPVEPCNRNFCCTEYIPSKLEMNGRGFKL